MLALVLAYGFIAANLAGFATCYLTGSLPNSDPRFVLRRFRNRKDS